MSKKSAFEAELNEIHAIFAKKLKGLIEKGEQTVIAGEVHTVSPSAATLNVIRTFLKDNNITCDKGLPSRPVGELAASMDKIIEETLPEDLPKFTN